MNYKYLRLKDHLVKNEAYLRDGRHRRGQRCSEKARELCDAFLVLDRDCKFLFDVNHFESALGMIKGHHGQSIWGVIFSKDSNGNPMLKTVVKINEDESEELL